MKIAILGSTGHTGHELTRQALERGHRVLALARNPERLDQPPQPALSVVTADVFDPSTIAAAVDGADILLSGLGVGSADATDTLAQGANAAIASGVPRIVWLGALGTGASRSVAGPLLGPLLTVALGKEIPEKVRADRQIIEAGHTVLHAGRLTTKPGTGGYRMVPVIEAGRLWFPPSISRTDLAALMLTEAERPRFPGQTVVTLRA